MVNQPSVLVVETGDEKMSNKFSELLNKMPARLRENVRVRTQAMAAELTLTELRKAFNQANISKFEREDMLLSTHGFLPLHFPLSPAAGWSSAS